MIKKQKENKDDIHDIMKASANTNRFAKIRLHTYFTRKMGSSATAIRESSVLSRESQEDNRTINADSFLPPHLCILHPIVLSIEYDRALIYDTLYSVLLHIVSP